jgi:hypothetical protein
MRRVLQAILILSITAFNTGCDDGSDRSATTASQFSYSVLTSTSGKGLDLLEELNSLVLPKLRKAGAQEYAIWSRASDSKNDFEEIAEDKLVVMLRWNKVKAERLTEELEAMTGVSDVTTSLFEVSLRGGDGSTETGTGFYIHRFDKYLSEDVDEVLSLSEQAWVTWEPFWGGQVLGVWRNLDIVDESNGITQLMRIAWYRDYEHWQETREFWREPESFELFIQRAALTLEQEGWSADVQPQ